MKRNRSSTIGGSKRESKKLKAAAAKEEEEDGNEIMVRRMDLLPNCLVEEILLRLPIKSVFTMAATARRYRFIAIDDPEFAARYRLSHPSPAVAGFFFQPLYTEHPNTISREDKLPRLLANTLAGGEGDFSVHEKLLFVPPPNADEKFHISIHGGWLFSPPHLHILHSVGGLLLCSRTKDYAKDYYVCNPVTKQWLALPEPPSKHYRTLGSVLLLDDHNNNNKNSDQASFSVLALREYCKQRLYIHSFSSKTRKWTRLTTVGYPPATFINRPPALVFHGSVYWMDIFWGRTIVYDIAKQSLHFMPLPALHRNARPILGGGPSGVLRFLETGHSILSVWSLCDDGQWFREHVSDISRIIDLNPSVIDQVEDDPNVATVDGNHRWFFKPLAFHPSEPDIVLLKLRGLLVTYHLRSGVMKMACKYNCKDSMVHSDGVFPYVHPAWPLPPLTFRKVKNPLRFQKVKKARRSCC